MQGRKCWILEPDMYVLDPHTGKACMSANIATETSLRQSEFDVHHALDFSYASIALLWAWSSDITKGTMHTKCMET